MENYANHPNNVRLKKIMKHLNLSKAQSKFVEATGQSKGNVSNYINDRKPASDNFIQQLCTHYNISEEDIEKVVLGNEVVDEDLLERIGDYARVKNLSMEILLSNADLKREDFSLKNVDAFKKLVNSFPDINLNRVFTAKGEVLLSESSERVRLLMETLETQNKLIKLYEKTTTFHSQLKE